MILTDTESGYPDEASAFAAGRKLHPDNPIRTFKDPTSGWTWLKLIDPVEYAPTVPRVKQEPALRAELAEVKAGRDAMRPVVEAAQPLMDKKFHDMTVEDYMRLGMALDAFRAAQQERADVNTFDRTPDERAAKLKRWGTQEAT